MTSRWALVRKQTRNLGALCAPAGPLVRDGRAVHDPIRPRQASSARVQLQTAAPARPSPAHDAGRTDPMVSRAIWRTRVFSVFVDRDQIRVGAADVDPDREPSSGNSCPRPPRLLGVETLFAVTLTRLRRIVARAGPHPPAAGGAHLEAIARANPRWCRLSLVRQ